MKENTDELLNEIDVLRSSRGARFVQLTEEQKRVLVYARSGNNPVGWTRLSVWWRERFGNIRNHKTLRDRYEEMVRSGEVEKYK